MEKILECKRKSEIEEEQMKDGYSRVKIKIKELRRGYKNAVDTGDQGRVVQNLFQKILNF